ncbi:MAG: hypothetical protein M5U26_21910 [Planctomycetota bacterium]|nr:hypothetical protein [Planctomycetota bacterium]
MRGVLAVLGVSFLLAGCSTDRSFKASHDEVVNAVVEAIHEEAGVDPKQIQIREEKPEKGRATLLTGPYARYSKFEARVVTREDRHGGEPELQGRIQTQETLYTRHHDWEERFLARVSMKLRKRVYGPETQPTSLPAEPIPEPRPLTPEEGGMPRK